MTSRRPPRAAQQGRGDAPAVGCVYMDPHAESSGAMACSMSNKRPRGRGARASSESRDVTNGATKRSYVRKKEEQEELGVEVRLLEAQVEELRRRAGLPTRRDRAAVDAVRARNFELEEGLLGHDRYLGRVQSMITNELMLPTVNPMSTFIHLPRDMTQRRAILRAMQALKLRRGIEAVMQRLHYLDHTVPYLCEESFTSATGEYHRHRFEINQFPNFKTVWQLYKAFVDLTYNMEISVTEGLGQLTLREDTEDFDPTIWNHRFVTVAEDVGCTEELNYVGFAHFYNHSPYTNSPMGIVVNDTVNVDDLYPYLPDKRTCKDFQAAHMMYEVRKPGTNQTIVVLKQCTLIVQLQPQFEVEPHALKQLEENSTKWSAHIIKYLRDYVVTE